MPPEISAIVATVNRPHELKRLLQSVVRQARDTEIIVVDQSDPPYAQRNVDLLQGVALSTRYLHTTERGTSHARNLGIRHASGAVLCFPDDDCEYPDGAFQRALQRLESAPLVSGQYVDWDGTRTYFPKAACEIKGVGIFGKLSAITFFVINQGRRNILFDERLGGGSELGWSEETDYAIRYTHTFGSGQYDPELKIFHKVRRPNLDNPAAWQAIERARGYILVKNWRAVGLPGLTRLLRSAVRDAFRREPFFLKGVGAALRRRP